METIREQIKPSSLKHGIGCLQWSIMMGLFLVISSSTFSQTLLECNYKAGTFSMTLEGHTTGVGFSSRLVLTNNNGVIQYITSVNSTNFQNVLAGNYLAYGITYENAIYVPNLEVGKNISLVSTCYKTVVVPTKVCNCSNYTGNLASSAITAAGGTSGRSRPGCAPQWRCAALPAFPAPSSWPSHRRSPRAPACSAVSR